MKENFKKAVLLLGMSITIPTVSIAQENIETDISADLVSGYIWRGQDLGNVSIYNPQIEMFARFKMKSSFHKTKRII